MKPAMEVIEVDIEMLILAGSADTYGMNETLVEDEEVTEGW